MGKNLGKKIGEVFSVLSSGHFICESSVERSNKILYAICEKNEKYLADYFIDLGYVLERGDGYFFFSKDEEPTIEYYDKKLKNFLKMIPFVEFMLVYDNHFGVGTKISVKELALSLEKNISLKERMIKMKRQQSKMSDIEACESIVKEFVKMGYAEVLDAYSHTYKIVDAYLYLETFIESIREITDEK